MRRLAREASLAGSVLPAMSASIMGRPLVPMMSEMTESSLMLDSSSVRCSRCTWLVRLLACPQQAALLLRGGVGHEASADQTVRQKIRQPCGIVHVGLAAGHVLDVLGVGQNQLKLAVAQNIPLRPPVDAVASMAICVVPSELSHSDKARGPLVVVANVRTSRSTLEPVMRREQATTVSLCTSSPAQLGLRTSMTIPPAKARHRPVAS